MEPERFLAKGHPLISSLHPTTLEITKDPEITSRGDCIVAVSSSKGCADLSEPVKRAIREGAEMYLLFEVPDGSQEIRGFGHGKLTLSHPTEMVFRKSDYVSPRTVLIQVDRSASDLEREFVESIKDKRTEIKVTLGSV